MPHTPVHTTLRTLAIMGIVGTALLASSAVAAAETETRAVTGAIQSIALAGPIDIRITQGETKGVELEGKPEMRARVRIETENGELKITWKAEESSGSKWSSGSTIRARVALPVLSKVAIKGSGDVEVGRFELKSAELQLSIEGSGDIAVENLNAGAIKGSIRGSGDIKLSGRVDSQSIAIAGSGDYDADTLQSRATSISVAGSGDVQVWATEVLDVSIAGSGDVRYKGNPRLSQTIRGSGAVTAY